MMQKEAARAALQKQQQAELQRRLELAESQNKSYMSTISAYMSTISALEAEVRDLKGQLEGILAADPSPSSSHGCK